MFSKTPNSKGSFFKRASSWKDKHSKQKAGNTGSTPEDGRLHKATSLNDVAFQAAKDSRVSDEASGVIGLSFRKIRLDDEISISGAAAASPKIGIDSFSNRYKSSPSCSKGAKASTGRSIPRPTFKSHLVDESQTCKSNQEQLQNADQYHRSIWSPEKRSVSSKPPASPNPFNHQLGKRSSGDGKNLTKKPVSVRFSTGNNTIRSSQGQPNPPNLCIGCHGPLQTPTNQFSSTPQADRSTSIKSPVFARHSTGNAVRTSQRKNDSSPKNCVSCHSPLQTPTNRPLGDASEGLSFNKSRISARSSPGEASRSTQNLPGTSAVCSPGKQQTPTYQLKNPTKADGSNPRQISTISSVKRQGTPHTTSTRQSSTDSRRGFPAFDPTERDPPESFNDYDVLKEARRVLMSLQRDVTQSLDTVSDLPSGVVRKSSGWSTASSKPLGVPEALQNLSIDSIPSTYETRLRIVEACQNRCLEYREMIKNIAESILEKTKRFDSSTVELMASIYESFVQLKVNCSDFKEMCAKGGSSGDARADGNLSNEMTLFVQSLCLNTMQMQNEVYLERLQTGFALIRAHCKLFRFMEACFIRD